MNLDTLRLLKDKANILHTRDFNAIAVEMIENYLPADDFRCQGDYTIYQNNLIMYESRYLLGVDYKEYGRETDKELEIEQYRNFLLFPLDNNYKVFLNIKESVYDIL